MNIRSLDGIALSKSKNSFVLCALEAAVGFRFHCNVTAHPTSEWVVQQLREAFPEAAPYRYAIFDHDSKFNVDVVRLLAATGLEPKPTSIQAPWQNGIAERWIGSCRREMLDRVIPLNERHLQRLLRDYASYHNDDRVHDALNKDAPNGRPVDERPSPAARVISQPRLGGLHHRYAWKGSCLKLARPLAQIGFVFLPASPSARE